MSSQHATGLKTPPFSVARFICEGYEQDPFKQMVVGMNEGISYAEAYRRMVALANCLRREHGVVEGDTVMIAAPNIVPYFTLIGAVQLVGATVALMSPTVERNEFAGIYDRVHPAVAIVSTEAHCRLAAECAPYTHVMTVTCLVDGVPSVERAWKGSAAWDGLAFDDDPKFILFTSGSTGTPKAVQLRGSSFCRHAGELTRALQVQAGEVFFIPVPFAHVYGVVALHTALSHHATVATLVKYRPEQAMSLITSVHANVYLGVSTMYLRELRENQNGEWDLSCLRAGLVAGATSPLAVFEEYEKRYGATLVNSYGMTETAATLTVAELDDPLRERAASVGHPIEGAEVRTAPLEATGEGLACPYPVEPDGSWRRGELVCKTPSLADGIIGEHGMVPGAIDAEGWLHTGDVGWVDANNYVWVDGRVKDMIIRGGINIYPAEVENTYQDHPQIAECCLVGYPDPDLGERTCLCVIMNEGADLSAFALREYAKGLIEKCKIPDLVMKMDEFPRLGNGKIDKKALGAHVRSILCPSDNAEKGSVAREG